MKVDAPRPECGHTPVTKFEMLDAAQWTCPACGHHEIEPHEPPAWYRQLLHEGVDPDAPAD